jgi:hypothetical protein
MASQCFNCMIAKTATIIEQLVDGHGQVAGRITIGPATRRTVTYDRIIES